MKFRSPSQWFRCVACRNPGTLIGITLSRTMPEGLCLSLMLATWSVYLTCVVGDWEDAPTREPSIFGDYRPPVSLRMRLARLALYSVAFASVVVAMVIILFSWSLQK